MRMGKKLMPKALKLNYICSFSYLFETFLENFAERKEKNCKRLCFFSYSSTFKVPSGFISIYSAEK
jgi:hypothetical protein